MLLELYPEIRYTGRKRTKREEQPEARADDGCVYTVGRDCGGWVCTGVAID